MTAAATAPRGGWAKSPYPAGVAEGRRDALREAAIVATSLGIFASAVDAGAAIDALNGEPRAAVEALISYEHSLLDEVDTLLSMSPDVEAARAKIARLRR